MNPLRRVERGDIPEADRRGDSEYEVEAEDLRSKYSFAQGTSEGRRRR